MGYALWVGKYATMFMNRSYGLVQRYTKAFILYIWPSSDLTARLLACSKPERFQPPVNIHSLLLRNHHDHGLDHAHCHDHLCHHDPHFRPPYASGSAERT
jgi:hypothetical protein